MRVMPFALLVFGFLLVVGLQWKKPQTRLSDSIVFEFNESFPSYSAETLRTVSFGYSRMMSSILWLRFLQHTPPKKVEAGQVSWIYRDLDALTEIDPDFFPAYEMGGIFLSVITEDKKGAEQILLKGTKNFPERWRLRAYLAYHYSIELGQPELARNQYEIGAKLPGAPALLAMRAGSLLAETKGKEQGIKFIEEMIDLTKDPAVLERLKLKLKKLKES